MKKKLEDIKEADLERYFAPLANDLNIEEYDPKIKTHSFLPVKEYYKIIPDKVRLWLNEESIKDIEMRENQYFDVKTYLYWFGIDIRNPSLSIKLIREKLFQYEEYKRKLKIQSN